MSGDDLQESDRLYRFQVAGRPELNQMHTAINMGGNNINNTGNINGQSATLKGDITSEDGWLITRNNKGWMNITHGGGFTMTDSQWIRAVNGKGITTTGEIKGGKSVVVQSGLTVVFQPGSIYSLIKQLRQAQSVHRTDL